MKKIGLIAIAMITVLATLGIGFSMWSQTVTVNGTVNTGNLSLSVTSPTGTWVYKQENPQDPNFGKMDIVKGTSAQGAGWEAGDVLIGSAAATSTLPLTCAPGSSGITVSYAFNNLFPIPDSNGNMQSWDIDFTLTNIGTVPVKLELGQPTLSTGFSNINIEYNTAPGDAYAGQQLDTGGTANVVVSILVPDNNNDQNLLNGTFSTVITAVQWNEYTNAPLSPNPPNTLSVPANSTLVFNATYNITNDEDSGIVGYWALDNYSKTVEVWETSANNFYAAVTYNGTWETFAGALSPQAGVLEKTSETGFYSGSYTATFTDSSAFTSVWGSQGSFDFGGTKTDILKGTYGAGQVGATVPAAANWLSNDFPGGVASFNQTTWGWTYTYQSQSWVNASSGNSGDILT
jgi:hypothetical protein